MRTIEFYHAADLPAMREGAHNLCALIRHVSPFATHRRFARRDRAFLLGWPGRRSTFAFARLSARVARNGVRYTGNRMDAALPYRMARRAPYRRHASLSEGAFLRRVRLRLVVGGRL